MELLTALWFVELLERLSLNLRYQDLTLSLGYSSTSDVRLWPVSFTSSKLVLLSVVSQVGPACSKRPPKVLLSLVVPRLLAIETLLTTNAVSKSLLGGSLKAKKVALAPLDRGLCPLLSACPL